ncbi:hypothetical protein GWI33_013237 [Rhynchophorus ferrugineus]|uniref:DNA-3-methyladenine glycosylase II n=1 Tax=Rhynchophorus ferrugineus TaxID=354439 RepID=A0A834IA24_RHYFE|nr:hypothetical protein GWI33_013237 [Rhynchophorus ferrugineus]
MALHCASKRLVKKDFNISCQEMAFFLLGKILVRQLDNGTILKGRIVETECYLGNEDKASKSYNGRRTPANEPMYMPFEPGAAVLLRSLEPIVGMEEMKQFRQGKRASEITKPEKLCDGPSKLCISMDIKKDNCNKLDLGDPDNNMLWVEDDFLMNPDHLSVVKTSRIGIESAGEEWAQKPLRFYIAGDTNFVIWKN